MRNERWSWLSAPTSALVLGLVAPACAPDEPVVPATTESRPAATPGAARDDSHDGDDADPHEDHVDARTLYVWAGDRARKAPDFLAVIDFDRHSKSYGRVLRTVPLPPPGNVGNEPHHCHTSADGRILACGGLLSLLRGQNDIFFFDITSARHPRFLFSTRAPGSGITDDFLPLPWGGFLVTNMGSASGASCAPPCSPIRRGRWTSSSSPATRTAARSRRTWSRGSSTPSTRPTAAWCSRSTARRSSRTSRCRRAAG